MSVKDMRFYRICPICDDILVGSDDGLEVYESLKDQVADNHAGESYTPNCTLCGEDCDSLEAAETIVAKGEPKLIEKPNG